MHTSNIHDASKNIVQILNNQCATLQELIQSGVYLEASQEVQKIQQDIGMLKNEAQKVEQLEMTLAVIGTMKAGKSTTINAIVGQEILPNRVLPMTTLPTLIRHKKGQHQPVLHFTHIEPTLKLIHKITQSIQPKMFKQGDVFKSDSTEKLAHQLFNGHALEFHSEYEGQNAINAFLESLNDLFRLAGELDITPPYHAYEKLSELPVIEVEFYHLAQSDEVLGTLSILDTPGPNEFGQSQALRNVFKTQLKQASGVMLVTDYTQLGGESAEKVNREVREIQQQYDDRLHVIVNKFDNDDGSMDYEQTKQYVAEKILGEGFSPDDVYPVSSRQAFLANFALASLQRGNALNPEQKLVEDFGKEAIGRKWKREISDLDEVQDAAKELWGESQFQKPVDQVITESYQHAAFQTMTAALKKVTEQGESQSSFVKARLQTQEMETSKLQSIIDGIEADITQIGEITKQIDAVIAETIEMFSTDLQQAQQTKAAELKVSIYSLFKEGKEAEKQSKLLVQQQQKAKNRTKGLLSGMVKKMMIGPTDSQGTSSIDFDPKNPKVEFKQRYNAQEYVQKVEKQVTQPFQRYVRQLEEISEQAPKTIADAVQAKLQDVCSEVIEKAQQKLGDEGLELKVKLPMANFDEVSIDYGKLFEDAVEEETRSESRSRKKSGMWNTFKGWFGREEYETYYVDKEVYIVDMAKFQARVMNGISRVTQQSQKLNGDYISQTIRPEIATKVGDVSNYFERFRHELLTGMADQKKSQAEKACIKQHLQTASVHLHDIHADAQDALNELDIIQ